MVKKAVLSMLFCLCLAACFKKHPVNENALLHQRACIESIAIHDHARAKTHCELCLEYDSSMPECLNGIGLVALIEKDEDRAKSFFTKALRQNNDFSQARNNLGVIHFSHGDFDLALRYFDRALEIDPSNTDARYNAGLSHFRLGQRLLANRDSKRCIMHFDKAKSQIKKLLAIEPTYHSAFRDLGLIELNFYELAHYQGPRAQHLSDAKAAFLQCTEAFAEEDGCYEGLAQVFLEEGIFDKSFANYFLCLTYAPNNSACRKGIVVAYEKSAKAQGGFVAFDRAVKGDPKNAFAHEAFCAALFERGMDAEGVRECEIALRLKPDLCSAQFRMAHYYFSVLNAEKAISHCQAFLTCGTAHNSADAKKCQEILTTARR